MKKQSIAIIAVVALVLAVAVGYALFSETITINGTATAKGNLDVNFTKVGTITKAGYTDATGNNGADIATIIDNGNTLKVTVNKLDYPGAYVEFPVTVTNEGSIDAILKTVTETGSNTSSPVVITYPDLDDLKDQTVVSGGTQTFTVRVEWQDVEDADNSVEQTANFELQLDYQQITVTQ